MQFLLFQKNLLVQVILFFACVYLRPYLPLKGKAFLLYTFVLMRQHRFILISVLQKSLCYKVDVEAAEN